MKSTEIKNKNISTIRFRSQTSPNEFTTETHIKIDNFQYQSTKFIGNKVFSMQSPVKRRIGLLEWRANISSEVPLVMRAAARFFELVLAH